MQSLVLLDSFLLDSRRPFLFFLRQRLLFVRLKIDARLDVDGRDGRPATFMCV